MMHIFQTVRYVWRHTVLIETDYETAGKDIGARLGPELKSNNTSALLQELSEFWKSHNLGDMKIDNSSTIIVTECYHCSKMPMWGRRSAP